MGKQNQKKGSSQKSQSAQQYPEQFDAVSLQSNYYVVESIRKKKFVNGKPMYYVKWKDWPDNSNTWEPIENLQSCLDLVNNFDQFLEGGGNKDPKEKSSTFSAIDQNSKKKVAQLKTKMQNKAKTISKLKPPVKAVKQKPSKSRNKGSRSRSENQRSRSVSSSMSNSFSSSSSQQEKLKKPTNIPPKIKQSSSQKISNNMGPPSIKKPESSSKLDDNFQIPTQRYKFMQINHHYIHWDKDPNGGEKKVKQIYYNIDRINTATQKRQVVDLPISELRLIPEGQNAVTEYLEQYMREVEEYQREYQEHKATQANMMTE